MTKERIILGIDPGTTIMGFGLIKVVGKNMEFLQLNELQLSKYDNHYQRLKIIFERTIELIETHHPDEIAIEAPFFGKNVQSMLKLGRAQGVAMAAGLSRDIPITEYEPKKIKMAITGNGNASKEQVAKMLQQLLGLKELPKNLDSTDGLAAAVCHFFNSGKTIGDTFAFAIESENAYGTPSDEQVAMIPLDVFNMEDGKVNTEEIYIGATVPMSDNEGHQLLGTVLDINEEFVKMDFNHPLAGIDLHFEGEIIGVRDASEEEVSHGHVHGEHGHQH